MRARSGQRIYLRLTLMPSISDRSGSQPGLAAQREERLDAGASTRRSNLANLRVVGHPVAAVIAALVEPFAVLVEAHAVAFVIVHTVNVVGVDLEAPDGRGVVDADVHAVCTGKSVLTGTSQMQPCCSASWS